MEIGNGIDREHRSDSRENWGRFSARAATRGANVRTTCVGGSVLLSFTLAKSQSRLTPTRAASERPSNPLRPLPSQPSLPPSFLKTSLRPCRAPRLPLLLSLLPPSHPPPHPFLFFSSRPRIWPQTIARSPRIVRERRGEEEGLRGFRGTREQGCLEDILLFSFFFFFTRIESSLSRGMRREEGRGGDERIFLLLWYATVPLVKRMFLLTLLSFGETLLFRDR